MKNSLLFTLLNSLVAIGIVGCIGGGSNNDVQTKSATQKTILADTQKKNLKDDFFLMQMGSGFNSITKKATSGQSCLSAASNQNNIYIANPTAMIKLDTTQDLETLQSNLGVDVSGSYGSDRFSMSMAADFAKSSKNNSYTTNIIYLYKYAGKAKFISGSLNESDAALTPVAAGMVHEDQKRFQEMCGDNFVEQMDAGATLAVKLTLAFNSHSDQEKFKAKFEGSVGMANIAASIKQAASSSKVHVEFSLSALQLGGEPQKLNKIFDDIQPSGNYPFIDCGSVGGSDEASCNRMMTGIIKYAKDLDNQLTNSDGSIKLNNLYYTSPIVTPYENIGVKVGAINPSSDTLQAMQALTINYDKTMYDYIFATHYLTALRNNLDTPTKNNLNDAIERLKNQINNVYLSPSYNILNCYKGIVSDKCVTIKKNIDIGVQNYALNNMEVLLLNYLENTSYSADLYVYNEGSKTAPESYKKTEGCILAPISAPNYANYALNCNGRWLDNPSNLKIIFNSLKEQLDVSGLSYYFDTPSEGLIKFIYPNTSITRDSIDSNLYYLNNVFIQVKDSDKLDLHLNGDMRITKLYHNEA